VDYNYKEDRLDEFMEREITKNDVYYFILSAFVISSLFLLLSV